MQQRQARFTSAFLILAMVLGMGFLSGCGESGPEGDAGEVTISLSDAEGDFITYEVEIMSILLTKKNGTKVETMPLQARVDFAEYVDLEELVTTATIPSGVYTQATLVLDYSQANIQVEDANGAPARASVVDRDGNPLSRLEVKVHLDDRKSLRIVPGVPAHLSLDFDLEASNTVELLKNPPLVTVTPTLLAEVNPEKRKPHRLHGPMVQVNEAESSFRLAIHPFHRRADKKRRDFGIVQVLTGDETRFEVDGVTGLGAEGFALLAEKPLFTAVIAFGDFNVRERVFKAREVIAGTSVPGGDRDAIRGSVIARARDTLTVRGGTLIRNSGTVVLNSDITLLVGSETKVTRQGEHHGEVPLDKEAISVGQAITAFGTISGNPGAPLTLDATGGLVRMRYTHLSGAVTALRPEVGELVLDLKAINGRPIALFDFTNTGSDPGAYVVSTGLLSLNTLSIGDPARLRGQVNGFGQAPPDFLAQTLIDASPVNAFMHIGWRPPTESPFLSASETRIEIDLSGTGPVHHVKHGHIKIALAAEPAPQLLPPENGRGRYAIRQRRSTTIHSDFGGFVRDLNNRLSGNASLAGLHAHGAYERATQSMTARQITIGLR